MKRNFVALVFSCIPALLVGCGRSSTDACLLPYVALAVNVTALDSISGANATSGSTVVIRDGAYADSAVAPELAPSVSLGVEQAGTFEVTVRKTGYRTWTKTGVRVERGECHVKTVGLMARLQPTP